MRLGYIFNVYYSYPNTFSEQGLFNDSETDIEVQFELVVHVPRAELLLLSGLSRFDCNFEPEDKKVGGFILLTPFFIVIAQLTRECCNFGLQRGKVADELVLPDILLLGQGERLILIAPPPLTPHWLLAVTLDVFL
jgi:hypothetical protein